MVIAPPPDLSLTLCNQICTKEEPLFCSHHDPLVFKISLPTSISIDNPPPSVAPIVPIQQIRIMWSQSGIEKFKQSITPAIHHLINSWVPGPSPDVFDALFQSSNSLLLEHATATNKNIPLPPPPKKT